MTRLKELRLQKGLTQKQVAEELNIPERTYQNYELGIREPGVLTAIKIATYFGCSVEAIFSEENL